MVNDEYRPRSGKLRLVFTAADGKNAAIAEIPFSLPSLGAQSYVIAIKTPAQAGTYTLKAMASAVDDEEHPTISHREVALRAAAHP